MKKAHYLLILILILISSGCASLQANRFAQVSQRPGSAVLFYEAISNATEMEKTHDAAGFPVRGFSYLRANRYLVGLKTQVDTAEKQKAWVQSLREFDLDSRKKEIQNLPDYSIEEIANAFDLEATREALKANLTTASEKLYKADQSRENFTETLQKAVRDPGEYSLIMRIAGVYPLVAIPIQYAAKKAYDEFRHWHSQSLDELPVVGEIVHFAPDSKNRMSPAKINQLFQNAGRDPFGLPTLSDQEIKKLAETFAPHFNFDIVDTYDRFGEVTWKDGTVTINTEKPTLYFYTTKSFLKGAPVWQLNYALWLEGRLGADAPRLEKGLLDGFTYRVTLTNDGEVLMAEVTNTCGCYYYNVPNRKLVKAAQEKKFALDPLVPAWLPEDFPEKQVSLRVNTGWHQVQNISIASQTKTTQYKILPYDILEKLPKEDGTTESVFDRYGIMKDSTRIEPYIFFSAGIPKVGYMRQRGNHPLKLVGYSHFTDPDIFDGNFIYK